MMLRNLRQTEGKDAMLKVARKKITLEYGEMTKMTTSLYLIAMWKEGLTG